jgi:hypothetical protein
MLTALPGTSLKTGHAGTPHRLVGVAEGPEQTPSMPCSRTPRATATVDKPGYALFTDHSTRSSPTAAGPTSCSGVSPPKAASARAPSTRSNVTSHPGSSPTRVAAMAASNLTAPACRGKDVGRFRRVEPGPRNHQVAPWSIRCRDPAPTSDHGAEAPSLLGHGLRASVAVGSVPRSTRPPAQPRTNSTSSRESRARCRGTPSRSPTLSWRHERGCIGRLGRHAEVMARLLRSAWPSGRRRVAMWR